jgi:plasmid maintenance system antidote protein VapI
MTKEILKKNIDEMEIYLPVSAIEKNLGMPKTTIQQVLNGHRNLPKKWVKVLERYFNGNSDKIIKSDRRFGKTQTNLNITLEKLKDNILKNNLSEEQILSLAENSKSKKEMPQGLSRADRMKWIRNNS